jgi:hypothetical protein
MLLTEQYKNKLLSYIYSVFDLTIDKRYYNITIMDT